MKGKPMEPDLFTDEEAEKTARALLGPMNCLGNTREFCFDGPNGCTCLRRTTAALIAAEARGEVKGLRRAERECREWEEILKIIGYRKTFWGLEKARFEGSCYAYINAATALDEIATALEASIKEPNHHALRT